jgi:hypothetical protein
VTTFLYLRRETEREREGNRAKVSFSISSDSAGKAEETYITEHLLEGARMVFIPSCSLD